MKQKGLKLIQWLLTNLNIKSKNYSKATFRLSFIGFLGSLGFYITVLHDLDNEPSAQVELNNQQIEWLKAENERLNNQLDVLIEKQ